MPLYDFYGIWEDSEADNLDTTNLYCFYDGFLCDSETCKYCSRVIEED